MTLLNACVVCLETKKTILEHKIISLQNQSSHSFVDFYSLHNSSLHSFTNFSIHLQLICSLINVISGNK